MSDPINEISPNCPSLKQSQITGIISSPTDEVAFDTLTDYVSELVDKIRSNYPSLKQWQVYAIVGGLINKMNNDIDNPVYEKGISSAILRLNEMTDI